MIYGVIIEMTDLLEEATVTERKGCEHDNADDVRFCPECGTQLINEKTVIQVRPELAPHFPKAEYRSGGPLWRYYKSLEDMPWYEVKDWLTTDSDNWPGGYALDLSEPTNAPSKDGKYGVIGCGIGTSKVNETVRRYSPSLFEDTEPKRKTRELLSKVGLLDGRELGMYSVSYSHYEHW